MLNSQKGFAPILILLIILAVAMVAGGAYYFNKTKIPSQIACTMEAKICPDGSSVGRVGSNCDFSPCPASNDWNIILTKSGGFAGVQETTAVSNTGQFTFKDEKFNKSCGGQLSKEQVTKVTSLINNAKSKSKNSYNCIDCFGYDLKIQKGNQDISIQLDDASLPESGVAPLIEILRNLQNVDLCKAGGGVDETANWKTYTNQKYGYSIEYPSNWTLEESGKESEFPTFYSSKVSEETWQELDGPYTQPHVFIYILDTPFSESLATNSKGMFVIKPQNIDIGGKLGYYYQPICAPDCAITADIPYNDKSTLTIGMIPLKKENVDYIKEKYHLNIKDIDEATFRKILSTFKFTN